MSDFTIRAAIEVLGKHISIVRSLSYKTDVATTAAKRHDKDPTAVCVAPANQVLDKLLVLQHVVA